MDYVGEHLLPGQLGHFFIILSLIASLVATFSYFRSAQAKTEADAAHWKKLARYAFITEIVSVFAIFGILFYIIHSHLFEYHYAWKHSSLSLEFKKMAVNDIKQDAENSNDGNGFNNKSITGQFFPVTGIRISF